MSKIMINQVGYAQGLPKHVAVQGKEPLIVKNKDGEIVQAVENIDPWFDPASGDSVALVDLGDLPEGSYTLSQGEEERKILVSREPFRALTNALVKGMYYQRCGIELEEKYAGVYKHPACHTGIQRLYSDPEVIVDAHGGWHDAGDYGKYVGPGAVAAAHMLYAWYLYPDAFRDELNIPESGNGVPDILNECRYELEWMMRMQRADGALYHKLTKKSFCSFRMPEDDLEQEYLMPPSHCATAAYAACAALASRIYKSYDEAFASSLSDTAEKAWQWLQDHPEFVPWYNPEDVRTGEYGDENGLDEMYWAAAELYAATGEEAYLTALKALMPRVDVTTMGWANVGGLGSIACLFACNHLDDTFTDGLKKRFLRGADNALELKQLSGYGTANSPNNYIWGSILPIMGNGMILLAAYKLTGEESYMDAALNQLDYMLGVNALDISFVTGFGEKPFMFPHHRPSASDGIEDPVPGLVSGGPNKRNPYATTRERLGKKIFPAKYYLDETPCADQNEIAIYWNSPAIFVAACFAAMTAE